MLYLCVICVGECKRDNAHQRSIKYISRKVTLEGGGGLSDSWCYTILQLDCLCQLPSSCLRKQTRKCHGQSKQRMYTKMAIKPPPVREDGGKNPHGNV